MVFAGGLVGQTVQFLPGADDVTGSMVAQSSTTAANLSANSYQRSGYTFTGWNTAEDGTGTPYGAGANFDFATDLTLYAQWELATEGPAPADLAPTGASDSVALGAMLVALISGAASVVVRRRRATN